MYFPDQQAFVEMIGAADLVPVHRTIIADLDTPLTLFAKVAGDDPHAFLFESMEGGEKWGRYSFIGLDPLVTFTSIRDVVRIEFPGLTGSGEERCGVNPLAELRALLNSFSVSNAPGLPKFYGGAVGFLGYDMVRFMEKIPDRHPPLNLPDSSFMVPGIVLIHDAVQQNLTVVCNVWKRGTESVDHLYSQACHRIEEIISRLNEPISRRFVNQEQAMAPHTFTSNMDEGSFSAMVERAKEYILAGDIIQVVLSQRFHTQTALKPFALYRALRHINPSPYLFYLRQGDMVLIGSSPEILVRLEEGDIELRPIAGTRKRGATHEEDLALERELLADPKERAEHLMLVDLGRNDVGRVAEHGSVVVRDLLVIERYSHVMHIVSGVHGRLAAGLDQFDVLEACFPAGTVSGAPKIRAMEIIDELEVSRRGPYAGAVGYFGFSGNMDFCITIRTFIIKGQDLWVQAGAGIVADSDPHKEYEETINKSMGLRRALELAEKGM
ncbi:anthranilate synthase, component I [Desulfobulbus propionicus DSM 2032]|jgi:anthranilate synthase component 1|uniref:Anthranilate synthase component 1 n=1 Tax=Desulfobulbus propionicus (strain ATCC 33891 / DSM 2032 / VKM B-1956 / 1pr3) TaxID=577650 RepID=A0A7U3YLH5_DESPD|nr:anthranilate synthase component I [Desulfobulbus propionicus]ADW17570.1 anthranilate synthase, component I [Desulfobulbus propionicus DSM 2032]